MTPPYRQVAALYAIRLYSMLTLTPKHTLCFHRLRDKILLAPPLQATSVFRCGTAQALVRAATSQSGSLCSYYITRQLHHSPAVNAAESGTAVMTKLFRHAARDNLDFIRISADALAVSASLICLSLLARSKPKLIAVCRQAPASVMLHQHQFGTNCA